MFRQDRLFDEQRTKGLEFTQQHCCHRPADATMKIDAVADLGSEWGVDLGYLGYRIIDRTRRVEGRQFLGAVELEGIKPSVDELADIFDDLGRATPADPAVGFHAIAHQTPEQLMDGHPQGLAFDVPERLINPGDRAHQDRATAVETATVHGLPQIIDARRILAHHEVPTLLDGCLNRAGTALDDRFTPTDNACIRFHFQEQPTRCDVEGTEPHDLHGTVSRNARQYALAVSILSACVQA